MFYDNLKQACINKGTSVTALLKELKMGTANGTFWKNGSSPSGDVLVQISEFLGVSVDYLLTGKEKSSKPDLSDIELELLEKFNRLLEIDKGRMLDRMETIYQSYTPEQKENVS